MATPQPASPSTGILRGLLPSLIVNAVCPFVLFQVLTRLGVPTLQALLWTSPFPLAGIAVDWARARRLNGIGLISLVLIVLGILTSLISGNVRFFLVKESFGTATFGLVCLISLLLPRPLLFYFGREFASGGDPARAAWFSGLWQYPGFRRGMRLMTTVWGVAYVTEALARVGLALVAPPSLVLVASPVLAFAVTALLLVWTIRYSQAMRRRGEAAGVVAAEQTASAPRSSAED